MEGDDHFPAGPLVGPERQWLRGAMIREERRKWLWSIFRKMIIGASVIVPVLSGLISLWQTFDLSRFFSAAGP